MLTEREKRFVEALASGMNATAAARAAGYSGSADSLGAWASRLRRKPHVAAALEERGVPVNPRPVHVEPTDPAIAGLAEQQRLLSAIARDERAASKDRIRAVATLHALQRRAPPPAQAPASSGPRAVFRVTHEPAPDEPARDRKNDPKPN
jgi:phage terminase small subunit